MQEKVPDRERCDGIGKANDLRAEAAVKGLVSVVIPIYNVEQYLERCLESIQRQTYGSLEVLLVNDGSRDGSDRIARRYAETDRRFRFFDKENGGPGDARNYGIDRAAGEYITFIDGDDYVSDDYVERLLALVNGTGADIVAVRMRKFWGETAEQEETREELRIYESTDAIKDMWYQKHIESTAGGKLYRREIFEEIRYPVGTLYEDLAVIHRLFYKADKVVWSSARLYYYFQREGSTMNCQFGPRKLDRLSVSRELLDWARAQCPELEDAAVARLFISNIQVLREMPMREGYEECWRDIWSDIRCYRRRVIGDREVKVVNRLIALATYGGTRWLKFLGKIYKKLER